MDERELTFSTLDISPCASGQRTDTWGNRMYGYNQTMSDGMELFHPERKHKLEGTIIYVITKGTKQNNLIYLYSILWNMDITVSHNTKL